MTVTVRLEAPGWQFRGQRSAERPSVNASEFSVGRRLGRELADLPRPQERPDALEGGSTAHDGSGAWRDSISVDGALWTAGIVPRRPAW